MKKRYQIFVSSTFADLEVERGKVMRTILNFDCFPAGMELFPAMDEEQFEYIKKIIDDSDYYMLIIGGRYGSVDESGVSWTEKEYDYAVSKHVPIIAFDHKDFTKLPAEKTDQDDEKRKKLVAFKKKVATGRLIGKWSNADDLALAVATSLKKVLEYQPRTGWVRADELPTDNKGALKELKELRDLRTEHQTQLREAQEKINSLEAELENLKTANGERATLSQVETITIPRTDVSFKMVRVEGGTFMMGASEDDVDADDEEKPAHKVVLSAYWIGMIPVTQVLWQAVMGDNPSRFKDNPNLPVENVSWDDCQTFIEKLNDLTGKSFSLPTEAQWEFAARGGNKSREFKYSGNDDYSLVAWCGSNSDGKTHVVAQKEANELGLYDMSGNVYEWCQDWYGPYGNDAQTNPIGPSLGTHRVIRGGSFYIYTGYCRVSRRDFDVPSRTNNGLGLRLAL